MGVNNYLETVVDGQARSVQYKWGHCWEIVYRIGDSISWEGMTRPAMADGLVEVAGCWTDGKGLNIRPFNYWYYAIAIDGDRIVGLREIDEQEAERLDRITDPAMGWVD